MVKVKILKGVYGHLVDGLVEAKTPSSEPFEVTKEIADRLVKKKAGEIIEDTKNIDMINQDNQDHREDNQDIPEKSGGIYTLEMLEGKKQSELIQIAETIGVEFKVGMSNDQLKANIVAAMPPGGNA